MLLDATGQGAAVSTQLMRRATALQMGQKIYELAAADFMRVEDQAWLAEYLPALAARSIQAASIYLAVVEASMSATPEPA